MLEMSLKINIVQCHHKKSEFIKNEIIQPIHVGAALSNEKLEYCIRDDEGENISYKNSNWCELTALYWQWKNVEADYYGLFHYRRLLSFNHREGVYNEIDLSDSVRTKHHLNQNEIEKLCKNFDIITSPYFDIHPMGLDNQKLTSYDFYCRDHYKSDLDKLLQIAKKGNTNFYDALVQSLQEKKACFGNIQIMKKEYFEEYCSMLFSILFELESELDIKEYDSYQKRVYGFLAERMLNAYVLYAKSKYQALRFTELGLVAVYPFSKKPNIAKKIHKVSLNEVINVCMTFDDNYLYHAMVAIASMIRNVQQNSKINLNLLCSQNLSVNSRKIICQEFKNDIELNFWEIEENLFQNFPLNRKHININTYYRLVIDKVLSHLDKVIYIDADVVVYGNIAELWNEDLEGNLIAGSLDEGGISQTRRLQLPPSSNYINAGVLIFNLKDIRKKYKDIFYIYGKKYLEYKDKIILQDQDILNIVYFESIKVLDLRWNINSRLFSQNTLERKYSEDDERSALSNAGIIHYTDTYKPWTFFCNHPHVDLYWKYRASLKYNEMNFKEKLAKFNTTIFKLSYKVQFRHIIFNIWGVRVPVNKRFLKMVLGRN